MRAHFPKDSVLDRLGNALPNASVTVYEPGTTDPIAQSMYAGPSGGSPIANPLTTDINGAFEFWLPYGQMVDLKVSAAGMSDVTIPYVPVLQDPADIVTLDDTQTLTNKTLSSPTINDPIVSGQLLIDASSLGSPALADPTDPDTGISFPSAGEITFGVDATEIATISDVGLWIKDGKRLSVGPAEAPSANMVAVSDSGTELYRQLLTVEYNNVGAVSGDISGIRSVLRDMTAGDSQLHAAEFHTIISSGGAHSMPRSALTLTAQSSVPSGSGQELFILRTISLPATWGLSGADPLDDIWIHQAGDGLATNFVRLFDHLGNLRHQLDWSGNSAHEGNIYSSGVGAHRVGMLAPGGASGGETWGGMYYDPSSDRLIVEVFEHGAGWRDTWVGASGGTLRIGTSGETVWKDLQLAASSSNLTLNAAPTVDDIPGASVTLTPGVWSITGTVMGLVIGAGDAGVGLICVISASAGTLANSGSAIQLVGAAGDVLMGSQEWKLTLTSGTATVKLRGYKAAGSGSSRFDSPHCVISARYLGRP